jgi:hypothetical protein
MPSQTTPSKPLLTEWEILILKTGRYQDEILKTPIDETNSKKIEFLGGIRSLSLFIQGSFTGPDLDVEFEDLEDDDKNGLFAKLEVNGEQLYPKTPYLNLLLQAKMVFDQDLSMFATFSVWQARYATVHQKVLTESSADLYDIAKIGFTSALELDLESELRGKILLEIGLFYDWYGDAKSAAQYFGKSQGVLRAF